MVKKFIQDSLTELDIPIKKRGGLSKFFKSGKLRVILINEDNSFKDYFVNFPDNYFIDIKAKSYLVVSKAILGGKYPTLIYFFNNPFPIFLKYEISSVTSLDLKTDEQKTELSEEQKVLLKNVVLDAKALNIAFHTKFLKGLFDSSGWFTYKVLLILLIVIAVITLVFLQIFGVIDIVGAFQKIK